jgi:hypothetical protein
MGIFMNVRMKMAFFWDVSPCSVVDIDRHCRGSYCFSYPDGGGGKLL